MVRNQSIIFLKRSMARDTLGQEKGTYEQVGKPVYAKVSSASGRLYYEAAQAKEEDTVLFRINFHCLPADFNKVDYRLQYNGKQYKIKHCADVDERHLEVQIRGVTV